MGESDFRPPWLRDPSTDFHETLNIYLLPGHDPARKISVGYIDVGGLTQESFCPLLLSSPRPQVAPLVAPRALYVIMRRSGQGSEIHIVNKFYHYQYCIPHAVSCTVSQSSVELLQNYYLLSGICSVSSDHRSHTKSKATRKCLQNKIKQSLYH